MLYSFLVQATPQSNPITGILPVVLIFAIFYFLVIRPMQRQKKDQQKILADLQNGNTVITTGGIIGTIVAIKDDVITLRLKPDGVKVQVARSAVSSRTTEETEK